METNFVRRASESCGSPETCGNRISSAAGRDCGNPYRKCRCPAVSMLQSVRKGIDGQRGAGFGVCGAGTVARGAYGAGNALHRLRHRETTAEQLPDRIAGMRFVPEIGVWCIRGAAGASCGRFARRRCGLPAATGRGARRCRRPALRELHEPGAEPSVQLAARNACRYPSSEGGCRAAWGITGGSRCVPGAIRTVPFVSFRNRAAIPCRLGVPPCDSVWCCCLYACR